MFDNTYINLVITITLIVLVVINTYMTNSRLERDIKEAEKKLEDEKKITIAIRTKVWIIWKLEQAKSIEELLNYWEEPIPEKNTTTGAPPPRPTDTQIEILLTELQIDMRVVKKDKKWISI